MHASLTMAGVGVNAPPGLERLIGRVHSESVAGIQREDDPFERRAVDLVQGGDEGAYGYLVSKYTRRVVSIAWGVVRNVHDAEDLAQEAFVKAFENISRFRKGEPFGPWIYRIVTNLSLDVLKHRSRVRHQELNPATEAARRDNADVQARSNEIAMRIDRAIESLPEMQRVVARLNLVEEFSHSEVAALTGLSEGTVRSHLSLARRKLREHLADVHGGDHE